MSSVATLQPAAVVFREEQYFDWRIYSVIALVRNAHGTGTGPRTRLVGRVRAGRGHRAGAPDVRDRLPPAHDDRSDADRSSGLVRLDSDLSADRADRHGLPLEVVTYRPIADYGFWGIRSGRDGERALIARGNRGVRLELNDGTKLLIGSQRPEALALALEQSLRPGV